MKIEVGKTYLDINNNEIEILRIDIGLYPYCYLGINKKLHVSNYYSMYGNSASSDVGNLIEEISNNPLDDIPKVGERYPEFSTHYEDTVPVAAKPGEAVNHPSHYGGKDDFYETIKVMEAKLTKEEFIGAMKFNVAKYNDRAKSKGIELENYEKALFYQTYLVNFLKRTDPLIA